jgi:formylglycine-generating enzyme required for sulfatase activity/CRISPR/Cas system-associated exonuclease Cas4 (RecB family)
VNESEPIDPARNTAAASDDSIEPYAYEPPGEIRAAPRRPRRHHFVLAAAFAVAALILAFMFGARVLRVETQPEDARIEVDGGLHLSFGSRVLLLPGDYEVAASAPGYAPLRQSMTVGREANQQLQLRLEPLPGLLELKTTPATVRVLIDNRDIGSNAKGALRIAAGTHRLQLQAERYYPHQQEIVIEGREIRQALEVNLTPAWGVYTLDSVPSGATVRVDGTATGKTPLALELLAGSRQLVLALDGYANAPVTVIATAGEKRILDTVRLQRADKRLHLTSSPDGASITLDGSFQGTTPLTIAVDSSRDHQLIAFKAGFERATRQIKGGSAQEERIALVLPALSGEVRIEVAPAKAEVRVGGRLLGVGSQTVRLPVLPQSIVVSSPGHTTQTVSVTPRPGFAQTVRVRLTTPQSQQATSKSGSGGIRTALGQELVLIQPGNYTMGSSRREADRGANEALRDVNMQRAFYLSATEVTNADFRRFRADHSSGHFKGKSLNGELQPAVALSWNDAARYCNWLSDQQRLPHFYLIEKGIVMGVDPAGQTGYRLPTEAEWEWAARMREDGTLARFAWGDAMPPPANAGNFADNAGAALLGTVIPGYDDGFAAASPVAKFAANRLGLFDIAGNASEWMHDFYEAASVLTPGALDPTGPELGEYHVIRGSSWRHGTTRELRLAFRDFGVGARPDVGFRIARYVK